MSLFPAFTTLFPLPRPHPSPPIHSRRHSPLCTLSRDSPIFPSTTTTADTLFNTHYTHPTPTGTAALAQSRKLPLDLLSSSYGHILATNLVSDLPIPLDPSTLSNELHTALTSASPILPDTSLLNSFLASPTLPVPPSILLPLSTAYAHTLAQTIRLAALELSPDPLTNTLRARLADPSLPFPMPQQQYDADFEALQSCAADVLATHNLDAANTFFATLRTQPDVHDLQNDGFILAVDGLPHPLGEGSNPVAHHSTIQLALRVRLLDGRFLVEPTFSDQGHDPDYVQTAMQELPAALQCAVVDMLPKGTKTVFYHPYAAHELFPLFMTTQPPPQAGLVVDLFLKRVVE